MPETKNELIPKVVLVPEQILVENVQVLREVKDALENMNLTKSPEYISRGEFMQKTFMSKTKFASVIKRLRHTRQGRTILIPIEEMLRYQRGEITI